MWSPPSYVSRLVHGHECHQGLFSRNLYIYVVDGSVLSSSAAVNPALTIMANALRVGDHLIDRLR